MKTTKERSCETCVYSFKKDCELCSTPRLARWTPFVKKCDNCKWKDVAFNVIGNPCNGFLINDCCYDWQWKGLAEFTKTKKAEISEKEIEEACEECVVELANTFNQCEINAFREGWKEAITWYKYIIKNQ